MQVLYDTATRQVLGFGVFTADPIDGQGLAGLADAEVNKLSQPGSKTLNADGTLSVDQTAYLAAQAATQAAAAGAARQRAQDAATLLNAPAVRDTQTHRDAFARLIGVQPLTISLGQDAQPTDILPL